MTLRKLKPYGPRGVAMLALSVLAFGRAIAYSRTNAPSFTPDVLIEVDHIIPTIVWGVLWCATGVFLVIGAYRRRQVPALTTIGGMSTLWAIVYVYTAVTQTVEASPEVAGSWITATVYLAITVIVGALTAMINKVEQVNANE